MAFSYDERENAGNNAAQAGVVSGGSPQRVAPPNDPASLRHQVDALGLLAERLASQRGAIRNIADLILGEEPPPPTQGNSASQIVASVGGVTAEIVSRYALIGEMLNDIDVHIRRLQRVSA